MSADVDAESIVGTLLESEGKEVVLHFADGITVPIGGSGGPLEKTSEKTDKAHIRGTVVEAEIREMEIDDDYDARFEAWVDMSLDERERLGFSRQGTTENGRTGFNVFSVRDASGEWDQPDARGHITVESGNRSNFSHSSVPIGDVRHVDVEGKSTTYYKPFGEEPYTIRVGVRSLYVDYIHVARRGDSKTLHIGLDHGERPRNPFSGAGIGSWQIPDRGDTLQITNESGAGFKGTFIAAQLFDTQLELQFAIEEEYAGDAETGESA